VEVDDLGSWTVTERHRALTGPRRTRGADTPLYRTVERTRTLRVCGICEARLAAGESAHAIRSGQINRQMMLFALFLILIALLTPIFLPFVRSALWRT
jgi:hypothetical protein